MLKSRIPQIVAQLNPRVGAALREGAEAMEASAKKRVHVDEGDLRDAIHVQRQSMVSYYVVAGDDEVFYGHMEEFGTSHSPPHPFMIPAFEEHRSHTIDAVAVVLATL